MRIKPLILNEHATEEDDDELIYDLIRDLILDPLMPAVPGDYNSTDYNTTDYNT